MAKLLPLSAGIEEVVRDGDKVAFEGFTHLIPYAAGHEAIRQRRKDLTLVRMTPGPDLRPVDRHGRGQEDGFLLGRQSRRRLAASLPRRLRAAAGRARWRSRSTATRPWPMPTRPARQGCPSPSSAAIAAPSCRASTPTIKSVDVPLHRRGAGDGARHPARQRSDPRAEGRPRRQRAAGRHRRRAEGSGAGGQAVAGDRGGDRRRPGPALVQRLRAAALDHHRHCRSCLAARIPPTHRATTSATTPSTRPGTRSRGSATASRPGWMPT